MPTRLRIHPADTRSIARMTSVSQSVRRRAIWPKDRGVGAVARPVGPLVVEYDEHPGAAEPAGDQPALAGEADAAGQRRRGARRTPPPASLLRPSRRSPRASSTLTPGPRPRASRAATRGDVVLSRRDLLVELPQDRRREACRRLVDRGRRDRRPSVATTSSWTSGVTFSGGWRSRSSASSTRSRAVERRIGA